MEMTEENRKIARDIQKRLAGKSVREATEIMSYVQQRISITSLVAEEITSE